MIEVNWLLFLVASTAVIMSPGQDMILVMARSITQGSTAGVITALGISSGLLLHTVLAALGVGALVQASDVLFNLIKMCGAAYLLYLGVCLLRTKGNDFVIESRSSRSYRKLFFDGAFSNVANPKIVIFFLAFLPQFVEPTADNPTLSIFALGLGFAALTFVIKAPVGLGAGRLSAWFQRQPQHLTWVYRVSGCTLIALSLKLALEDRA